jgi:hypothetical protein
LYPQRSVFTNEQMKNWMMVPTLKYLLKRARRRTSRIATMVLAMALQKVLLVAVQLVAIVTQPLLAMGVMDLVLWPRRNQPNRFVTKGFKTIHLR